jgi:chromosome segregation ATPase
MFHLTVVKLNYFIIFNINIKIIYITMTDFLGNFNKSLLNLGTLNQQFSDKFTDDKNFNSVLLEKLNTIKNKLVELSTTIESLKNEVLNLRLTVNNNSQAEADLKKLIEQLTKDKNILQQTIAENNTKIENHQAAIQTLTQEKTALENNGVELKTTKEEVEKLNAAIVQSRDSQRALTEKNNSLNSKYNEAERQLIECKQKIQQIQTVNVGLEQEIKTATDKINEVVQQMNLLLETSQTKGNFDNDFNEINEIIDKMNNTLKQNPTGGKKIKLRKSKKSKKRLTKRKKYKKQKGGFTYNTNSKRKKILTLTTKKNTSKKGKRRSNSKPTKYF